jgi:hypothetical protein
MMVQIHAAHEQFVTNKCTNKPKKNKPKKITLKLLNLGHDGHPRRPRSGKTKQKFSRDFFEKKKSAKF